MMTQILESHDIFTGVQRLTDASYRFLSGRKRKKYIEILGEWEISLIGNSSHSKSLSAYSLFPMNYHLG